MKKLLTLFLAICMLFALCSCSDELFIEEFEGDNGANNNVTDSGKVDWAIYWYLCGSDLETNGGFATNDLVEMMEVELPENVKVVIQTGGSQIWQNDVMDASLLQRYVYNSEGLTLVDEQPSASMGDEETLADFLEFAKNNYPADKTAVLFWNHGGGSVSGAAFDELYGFDSLTLDELYRAFATVWDLTAEERPLELIGFDTCLMATVDVAYTFCDIGKYLVASEEVEPGNGWLYSGWLGALAANPDIDGAALGTAMCDSYYEGCEAVGTADSATLSLIDLAAAQELIDAYEFFGAEALAAACEDPSFFASFGRAAISSENYGGNTKEQGYTNMVDLGHLARLSQDLLPNSSAAVLDALENCVVYKVNGPYRSESTGLSCYYSYSADLDDFAGYESVGVGEAFKYYFSYGLTGTLEEDGIEYVNELNYDALPERCTIYDYGWDGIIPELDEDGSAVLTLGEDAIDVISSIGFQLYYADPESDIMFLLGSDNDMLADWESGVFKDNFRGTWGAIDGYLVYMELCFEGDDYNLYSVPVLLNGEEYNLQVVYDFAVEEWEILGARKALDESGMADKNLRLIEAGDIITTIHYVTPLSDDTDEFEAVPIAEIEVTADTCFSEADLGDGMFVMIFEMCDAWDNYAYSDAVVFESVDGEIYTSVLE